MSFAHVYPAKEEKFHNLDGGCDCICEPRIIDCNVDDAGNPARVFVHERLKEVSK